MQEGSNNRVSAEVAPFRVDQGERYTTQELEMMEVDVLPVFHDGC